MESKSVWAQFSSDSFGTLSGFYVVVERGSYAGEPFFIMLALHLIKIETKLLDDFNLVLSFINCIFETIRYSPFFQNFAVTKY